MKILICLKAGIIGSARTWRGLLLVWFCSLLLVSMVAIPMKSSLKTGLGNSMITEKLSKGINVEVFADLGANFRSLNSFFLSGLLMTMFVGFLINSFLAGGLFNSVKGVSVTYSSSEFLRASAKYFWSFIVISLIISVIIFLAAILIIVIPVAIVSQSEVPAEGALFKTCIIAIAFFLLVLTLLFLVADYARAWQVSHDKNASFKALGFGLRETFRSFLSSYPLMLILLISQLLYGWLVLSLLPGIKPVSEGGIILLFIFSQLLFFIKILMKALRYGSVTSMMELNADSAFKH